MRQLPDDHLEPGRQHLEAVAAAAEPEVAVGDEGRRGGELDLDRAGALSVDDHLLERQVVAAASAAVGVRPRVEFAAADEIYDPARQTKAVRFVDAR